LDGGAEDEVTLRRNQGAFRGFEVLTGLLAVDTATTLFGKRISAPLLLSPAGLPALFHRGAEPAVARAAGRPGVPYALSTLGTTRIEDLGAPPDALKLSQIYPLKDRGLLRDLVARCREQDYAA
jgi:L-lactate dehydrogenase (cytochrome)